MITPSHLQTKRSIQDTEEFRRNYTSNEFHRSLYALENGWRGQGVIVGVIDDGVLNVNGELDGRLDLNLSKDFGTVTSNGETRQRNEIGSALSTHGTAIANIIAGADNGSGAMGFAPDATIAALRISNWNADTQSETLTHIVEALDYATSKNIKLLNISLTSGTWQAYTDALTRFGQTGGMAVLAAGNSAGTDPVDAGAITKANRDAIIFVVGLADRQTSYSLASYSNAAGIMAERTVAAVSTNYTTLVNGAEGTFSGTSSAAPVVTALAATILSKWPQLSGQQAGEVILNTATDIGDAGIDAVYGRGMVNFEAALSPVEPSLSNGSQRMALATSTMSVSSAMNVESIRAALSDVTVLDRYDRDFTGSVAGQISSTDERSAAWLQRRVAIGAGAGTAQASASGVEMRLDYATVPYSTEVSRTIPLSGAATIATGRSIIRAGWNAQDSLQTDVMGLAPFTDGVLAYAPQAGKSFGYEHRTRIGSFGLKVSSGNVGDIGATGATLFWSNTNTEVRVSVIAEQGTVAGVPTGSGALKLAKGANTSMIEVHHRFGSRSGWDFEGYGSIGRTRLQTDPGSLVTGASEIIGTRFGIQATGPALGGSISVGLVQPLTIEGGAIRLTLPDSYDLARKSLLHRTEYVELAGQRPVQVTAGYTLNWSSASFRMGMLQDLSSGSTSALGRWSVVF